MSDEDDYRERLKRVRAGIFGVGEARVTTQAGMDTLHRGQQFEAGPKQPRRDVLARLIDEALAKLGRDATTSAVLHHIEGAEAVQEIDYGAWKIYWRGGGRERKTSFKAFANRLSERRKLPQNK
jgi:hypothetical protein